jgi:hypothetical protein
MIRSRLLPCLLTLLASAHLAGSASSGEFEITVRGPSKPTTIPSPVSVPAPEGMKPGAWLLMARTDAGLKTMQAGVIELDGERRLVVVRPERLGRERIAYEADPLHILGGGGLTIDRDGAGPNVAVTIGGKPFTTLVLTEPTKPYFYPMYGPTQEMITRSYPMDPKVEGEARDHNHQRSHWLTHGDVNGFDFWASDPLNKPNPKFGRIVAKSVAWSPEVPSPVVALRLHNEWLAPDGHVVAREVRTYTFADLSPARGFDVESVISAPDDQPVTFGATKEGMFGFRVASSMDVKAKTVGKINAPSMDAKARNGGRIVNAEGLSDGDAWGKPSPWVDYTGPVAGQTVGIAILNHPSSFRFPTTWHVRDYGLFAANPFGYKDFGIKKEGSHTIAAGQSIRFVYRVILHKGTTSVAADFAAFADTEGDVTVSVPAR